MINSFHYFNQNKQQIFRLKTKAGILGFLNKNTGKYLASKLQNLFLGLRIMLISLAIISLFI
jgi:hypothetical protein